MGSESDFLKEKTKKKPINYQKRLKKLGWTVISAIIFGVVASLIILLLEPYMKRVITPSTPDDNQNLVSFPEDMNEKSPEEMLNDYMQQQSALLDTQSDVERDPVELPLSDEQIEELLRYVTMDVTSYRQLSTSMAALSRELNKYMVTVTSTSSSVDWLDSVNASTNTTSGVIIANNSKELLILADSSALKMNTDLEVTFYNGVKVTTTAKGIDYNTKLAVFSVDLSLIPEEMDVDSMVAVLGSSIGVYVGLPLVAVGSPRGVSGSMGYGIIDIPKSVQSQTDSSISIIQTNIGGSKSASGAVFNLQGQVVGIITNSISSSSGDNVVVAYGISELKTRIEKISNGESLPYLGITATDVTSTANTVHGVPFGAYITAIEMDSPAMKAGIQKGDIVTRIDDYEIMSYSDYISVLNQQRIGNTLSIVVLRKSQTGYSEIKIDIVVEERN